MKNAAAPPKLVGSQRLSTMRFMLRGREEKSQVSTSSSFPTSVFSGEGLSRLVCIRDEHTTAQLALDTSLLDNGGIVSGRRSFGGANKSLEAVAKAAYADAETPEVPGGIAPTNYIVKESSGMGLKRKVGAGGRFDATRKKRA